SRSRPARPSGGDRRAQALSGCGVSVFFCILRRRARVLRGCRVQPHPRRARRDRLPVVIDALRSRRVHLTGLRLLVPHLTAENCEEVLARAAGKSKRDIEELVAHLAPQTPVAAVVRKMPAPSMPAPALPTAIAPAPP